MTKADLLRELQDLAQSEPFLSDSEKKGVSWKDYRQGYRHLQQYLRALVRDEGADRRRVARKT